MQESSSLEEFISKLRKRKRKILLLSILLTFVISISISWYKANTFYGELKFYISSSEFVDYNTITDKSFVDISVNESELLRLQSFAFSKQLLEAVMDTLIKNNQIKTDELVIASEKGSGLEFLSNLFQVDVSPLGELVIHSRYNNKNFIEILNHRIMHEINAMNNAFLSDFKSEKIEASEKQITLLEDEKRELFTKANEIRKQLTDSKISSSASRQMMNKEYLQYGELFWNQNATEYLELNILLQKISNIDERIESLKRIIFNDKWSVQRLKYKKPFITSDLPIKNLYSPYNSLLIFGFTLLISLMIWTLIFSLMIRYEKYLKLVLGKD